MKKTFFFAIAMAVSFISCTSDEPEFKADSRTVTFDCQGFEMTPFGTRAELSADGKALTDLWILDYVDGSLSQQLHQVSTDADFGTPTLNLALGDHHVYFIASRGQDATIDTDAHTMTFRRVLDTFYKDYAISINSATSGSRTVTLERCVTRLRLVFTDAIPAGASTFNVIPTTWYYTLDYTTGLGVNATASQAITINIPSSEIGVTGEAVNVFGFSESGEWATDVAIDCKTSTGTILGTATITDAPLMMNRTTEYSGQLFSSNGLTTVNLSTDWSDAYTMTW